MPPLTNRIIGEYRLVDFLGAGGMGEVYRAIHTKLGRVVAIKVLHYASQSSYAVERFLNEARIQSSLRHPNVAALHEFLELDSRPAIVMEFVDGQTLHERLRARGRLDVGEVVSILRPVCDALAYIHAQGIVHRDIKSGNIKINSAGEVKLLDFGIAKAPTSARLTKPGDVVGTLENLSPEQVRGAEADARSDIWAVGTLLYEMLTGRAPFSAASTGDLYKRIAEADYVPISTSHPAASAELEAVAARCLKKRPADRYQSAAELVRDLDRLRQPTAPAKPHGKVDLASLVRKPWVIAVATVVLLAIVVAVIAGLSGPGGSHWTEQDKTAERIVTVDVAGPAAEVYRNGRVEGRTPFDVRTRAGQTVSLTLRRSGCADLNVQFEATDRSNYTYLMECGGR
jgi:eukaryotic-like serine/threonine-protein kinase